MTTPQSQNSTPRTTPRGLGGDGALPNFHSDLQVVVRNTFLEFSTDTAQPPMIRSRSDSDLASSRSVSDTASEESYSAVDPMRSSNSARSGGNQDLPSRGSADHFKGTCQPCCFFRREKCVLDTDCKYCHYTHEAQQRPGKKARAREKARMLKQGGASSHAGDRETEDDTDDEPRNKSSQQPQPGAKSKSGYPRGSKFSL
mmetsp:Transcript_3920/g.6346  ORF Transcript_3920/g.6346 Transcript_3920/m.6346 type:complete len:200 (-) Transcript_3920:77-676(-)